MALSEFLGDSAAQTRIQIFATDISDKDIQKARAAVYSESLTADLSREQLRRFFTKIEGGYQIIKEVRELCVFARHDVTRDPPFSRMDLISCRNLLIYFTTPLQRKVLGYFHYALKPTGFLLLGKSESVGAAPALFSLSDRRANVYTRVMSPGQVVTEFRAAAEPEFKTMAPAAALLQPPAFDLRKEAERIVLERYAPPALVVDPSLQVLFFQGDTSPFLKPALGEASFSLLKLARPDLMLQIRAAVQKAKRSGAARRENVRFKRDGESILVDVEVVPIAGRLTKDSDFVVLFQNLRRQVPDKKQRSKVERISRSSEQAKEIQQLERELVATQENLRALVEDQEAASEELRAANEEILSSNEELQSTNEELETAKEELQSSNEELTTLNEELQNRNVELTQVNDDITNLLVSANLPIIMLGNDLRIRRFTPHAEKMFNLLATDVGRSIIDINMNPKTPDMSSLITDVIDSVTPQEIEVKDNNGRWYSIWIRPYRTADNKIDGAVIAFVDIDRIKQAEEKLRAHTEQLEEVVEERTRMLRNSTRMAAIGETAGMVGHDLRNPLQTIINTVHLAMESMKSGGAPQNLRIEKMLETIREQADFMNKIVSDLQDYARQPKPSFVEYDLQGLIDDTRSSISIPTSVEVLTSFEPGFPKLTVDPNLLRRAFTNIIANALQAMPEGGQLRIKAWKNKELATISFQDTGKGIPEDIKAKIFNPLFTTRDKGVGLGLAVAKQLVESHHGDIKVSSKVGEGTTFTVEIPLDRKI